MSPPEEILIVDDEVGIRELLSEILQDEGYRVSARRKRDRGARLSRASSSPRSCCSTSGCPTPTA